MTIDIEASLEAARRQNAEGCVKTTEDLDRYRRVIANSRPDGVIEIGSFSGKSALWFAREASCPVFSVDVDQRWIDPDVWAAAAEERVSYYLGDSRAPETIQAAFQWMRDYTVRRPMVVLDGDHSANTVAAELQIYSPWVTKGGYCIVEDGLVRWMPWEWRENGGPYTGSPLDAIESFLSTSPQWEVDEEVEAMHPVTQFPRGWLRRAW